MMKKTNEKKVLHKVKKRWLILGTALFALAAAGAYPDTASADTSANHSLVQDSTTSSADDQSTTGSASTTGSTSASTTTTSSGSADNSSASTTTQSSGSASSSAVTSGSSTVAQSSGSSSASSTAQDDGLLYRDEDATSNTGRSTSANNLSLADSKPSQEILSNSTFGSDSSSQYSVGVSLSTSISGVYHGAATSISYTVQFANSGSESPITGISNLVQHVRLSDGSESSASADVKSYSSFNPNFSSTADTPISVKISKTNSNVASTASQLTFSSGPLDSTYNNEYYSGDQIWWTFDVQLNYNFSGALSYLDTAKPTYTSTVPIEIKFLDSSTGQPIKSSKWLTGDNIYPNNTFSDVQIPENVINIDGYKYSDNSVYNFKNNLNVTNSSTDNFTISGYFSNTNGTLIELLYNPIPASGTVKYIDSTNNSEIASEASFSGSVGSSYSTQSVVDSLTGQGYSLVSNAPSTSITLNSSSNDYVFNFVHKTSDASQSKTFTRNINFIDSATNSEIPSQPSVSQTVTYSRSGTYDEVTKSTSYGNWFATNKGSFAEYAAPSIAGYDNPNPTSVPSSSVNSDDSTTTTSATIVYTKTSSSATPSSSSATPTPSSSTVSYSQAPVSSSSTYVFVSSSASSTSTASSSSAPIVVASVATKMYNNETQLVKSGNQILIYIEPRYANSTGVASDTDSYVVNIQNSDGTVSHTQLVTLDQYNAMLTASGKAPYTPEDLQQAYDERVDNQGVLYNDETKTTFDAKTVQKGNDTFIFTDTKENNHGFKRPKDGKLVKDNNKKKHSHKGKKSHFKNKKKQIKNRRNHMKMKHHHDKKRHMHHKK